VKIVSFVRAGESVVRTGALLADRDEVLDFGAADLPRPAGPRDAFDLGAELLPAAQALHARIASAGAGGAALRASGALVPRAGVRLVAPVPRPRKVICIGLNYRDHAAESGLPIPERPLFFSKFPTSVIGAGEPVVIPPGSEQVDYEAELAVVIGRRASRIDVAAAYDHVLGYTNFNDVSARDFQFADGQWQRGKSCDTFAPTGEYVATKDEIPDPHALSIRLRLNGATMQDSSTAQLVFGVPELVSFLSQTVTLEPGDLIATGTPPGVGFARKPPVFVRAGDVMEVEIEGLGRLSSPVLA